MEDFETRIERIPVPVPPRLAITTKDGTREIPLGDGQLILGRGEDNDVVVAADAVSRRHASLELRDEGVLIKDLGSTNGIAVDGQVMPEILLLPDMQVTIGTSVALAYLPPEAAPTALEILEALAAAAAAGTGTGQGGAADEEVTATAAGPDVHTEEPAPQADIPAEEPAAEATAEAVAIAEEPAPEADILVEEPVIEATAEADALAKEPAADVVVVEEEPGAAMAVVEEEPAADVVVIAEEQAAVMAVVEEEPAADVVVVEEEPVIEAIVIENEPADEAAVADEAPADSWYVARGEGEPAWQGGPYTWAQLAALAQDGSLTGAEFVWYESRQEWVVVSQVPELLPQPAAVAAPDVTVVLPIQGEPGEASVIEAAAAEPPAEPGGEELEAAPAVGDDSQGWYLSHSGAGGPDGPYAWSELPALGRDGAIRAGDLVWHASYADWVPVEQVPDLAQYLPAQAAPATAVVAEGIVAAAPEVAAAQPADEAWEEPPAVTPASTPAEPATVPDLAVTASVTLAAEPDPSPAAVDMAAGWYMSRGAGGSAWQGGPYSWEELVGYARDGRLVDGDLVWHAAYGDWVAPAQVPGLRP